MIELAIGASLVALSAFALRALRARDEAELGAPPARPKAPPASPHRGLVVGDVLLHGTDELWVAGTLTVRGDDDVVLFWLHATPGAQDASFLAQLDERAEDLALLEPSSEMSRGRPPDVLRIRGLRLELRYRQEASIEAAGESLPRVAPEATVVRWDGPGDRVALLIDGPARDRLVLVGRRVDRGMFELLPGGDLPT